MLCNSYNSKILYEEFRWIYLGGDIKLLLVTVNNRLILKIEIVHDLSCHPIFKYLCNSSIRIFEYSNNFKYSSSANRIQIQFLYSNIWIFDYSPTPDTSATSFTPLRYILTLCKHTSVSHWAVCNNYCIMLQMLTNLLSHHHNGNIFSEENNSLHAVEEWHPVQFAIRELQELPKSILNARQHQLTGVKEKSKSRSHTTSAHGAAVGSISLALSQTLQDHGYGHNESPGMSVYFSAFFSTQCVYPWGWPGWVNLAGRLHIKTIYQSTDGHSSTEWVQPRAIRSIETNVLTFSQTVCKYVNI